MKIIFPFPESHAPPPLRFLKQQFSCFKDLFAVLGSRTRPFRHLPQFFVHQKNTTGMSWSKERGANKKKEGTPEKLRFVCIAKILSLKTRFTEYVFVRVAMPQKSGKCNVFGKAASRKQDKRHFLTKGQYFIQKKTRGETNPNTKKTKKTRWVTLVVPIQDLWSKIWKTLGENTGTPVLPVSPVFPHDWNMAYVSEQKKKGRKAT